MNETGYLILAIVVIVALLAIFVTSFILYVRTPVPKGCEKSPSDACDLCPNKRCEFYLYQAKGSLKESQGKEEKEENKENPS